MKRAWMVLFLPLVAACGESPTQPIQSPNMPAPSQAVVDAQTYDLTGQTLYGGGCGIADLNVTKGTEWMRVNATVNKNRMNVSMHIGFSGVQALDDAGNHYQIPVSESISENTDLTGTTGEVTESAEVRIIGAGTVVDARENQLIHVTVNPNGTVTSTIDRTDLVCH